ncbi:MAG: aminopeptidase P family protein [Anaerolineales bacterium]|nr:aminopeptidase P family protein [Anaerolineales bacterium]
MYRARHNRLALALQQANLNALALNPGPSLVYLTGLHFHLSERPVLVFFVPHEPLMIALPELEMAKVKALPYPVQAFPYPEDPLEWPAVFRQTALAAHVDKQAVGVEPRRIRLLEYRLLQEAAPKANYLSAEESIAALRMQKDGSEISAMRKAAQIAQEALQATLPQVRIGITEKELAAELTLQLLRAGSDPEMAFAPIVSAGPNSANPHATPTARPLAAGDLLVIDWGASYQGYLSDITRTFAIGEVEPELQAIAKIVGDANAAGRAAVRPGVAAGDIDASARSVIDSAGYGKYFTHRTGHGLGMEAHEEPYIRSGNSLLLKPGMTFTIEPGIYLPERNGVRIEDDVVVTENGMESLTDLPRELLRLA